MAENGDQPKIKKQKTEEMRLHPVFLSFLDREEKKDLDMGLVALDMGLSDMILGVLHVDACNSLDQVNFKDSTIYIKTSAHDLKPDMKGKPKGGVIGDVFLDGLDVLKKYLNMDHPQVPQDKSQQEALLKLLIFLTSKEDHKILYEEKDGEANWDVILAQHLLSKLAVKSTYTITEYRRMTIQDGEPMCECNAKDKLVGEKGDTSFGCLKGWHGEADIMMEDVAVTLFQENPENESESASCIEMEVSENFCRRDICHVISETIVFSFLQRKVKNGKLKNSLIPVIGFGAKSFLICFYDSENDVLLQSRPVEIFDGNALRTRAVLFLWLTLNYEYFCSGISQEMKACKADFIKGLGDNAKMYFEDVARPLHQPDTSDSDKDLFPWSSEPRPSEFRHTPSLRYLDLRQSHSQN